MELEWEGGGGTPTKTVYLCPDLGGKKAPEWKAPEWKAVGPMYCAGILSSLSTADMALIGLAPLPHSLCLAENH